MSQDQLRTPRSPEIAREIARDHPPPLRQVLIVVTFHSVGLLLAVGATFTRANSGTLSMLFMSFCFLFTGIFVPPSQMPLPELRFA